MSVQIQTPNITAQTDRERISQMQSYLYQMAKQLQWAFDTLDSGSMSTGPVAVMTPKKEKAQAADPLATFASLKSLIIKSADIVNAYYDTISSRLEGLYVAQSDFGIYAQETSQEIEGNSEGIKQLFTNNQTIVSQIGGLTTNVEGLTTNAEGLSGRIDGLSEDAKKVSASVDDLYAQSILTNAYIKTGLLFYAEDGTPVYGLEIGQTNTDADGNSAFDKFARFSADRLSFFDQNDVEVAYISDYKLYITNAEITGTLYLTERFKIYYNHGLAFQWTGGGS